MTGYLVKHRDNFNFTFVIICLDETFCRGEQVGARCGWRITEWSVSWGSIS